MMLNESFFSGLINARAGGIPTYMVPEVSDVVWELLSFSRQVIVHKNEFLTGFEQISTRDLSTNKSDAPKYGAHSLFLWSYQVSFIYNVTQERIVVRFETS